LHREDAHAFLRSSPNGFLEVLAQRLRIAAACSAHQIAGPAGFGADRRTTHPVDAQNAIAGISLDAGLTERQIATNAATIANAGAILAQGACGSIRLAALALGAARSDSAIASWRRTIDRRLTPAAGAPLAAAIRRQLFERVDQ